MAPKKEPPKQHWLVVPLGESETSESYYTTTAKEAAEAWIEDHRYSISDYENEIELLVVPEKVSHRATRQEWTIEEVTE